METNFDFQIAFMLEAYFWRSKHLLVKMKIPFTKNIIHVIQAYFWKRKFSQMSRYTEKYTHLLFIVWQAVLKE